MSEGPENLFQDDIQASPVQRKLQLMYVNIGGKYLYLEYRELPGLMFFSMSAI